MPHFFLPHNPMVADVVKTLFLMTAISYFTNRKIPELNALAVAAVAVILYWTFVADLAPASETRRARFGGGLPTPRFKLTSEGLGRHHLRT